MLGRNTISVYAKGKPERSKTKCANERKKFIRKNGKRTSRWALRLVSRKDISLKEWMSVGKGIPVEL